MAEYKDICSSSPGRTPKLQLAAEQLLTAEYWIPPKKDSPHPRAKEKPQQNCRRDKITFRIKPHTHQKHSEGSNKPCTHQDPETPHRLRQNCVWMFPEKVWVSSGLPQGQGLWVQQTWVWYKPSLRRSSLTPPQSHQNLHRKQTLGGKNRTLYAPGPRRKEQ